MAPSLTQDFYIYNKIEDNTKEDKENNIHFENKKPIKYYQIFFRPISIITSIATFLAVLCLTYFEPTLSLRLDDFGLSSLWIGAFFTLAPITYTISSLSISCMTSKIDPKYIACIGLFLNGVSQFLIGPSSFLPDSLVLMVIGQLLHGFTACMFLITSLPVIIDDALIKFPNRKIDVSDTSSAIFNAFQSIGNMIGPIQRKMIVFIVRTIFTFIKNVNVYGSNVTDAFGFRTCSTSMGCIVLVYLFIYILIWKTCSNKAKIEKKESKNEEFIIKEELSQKEIEIIEN